MKRRTFIEGTLATLLLGCEPGLDEQFGHVEEPTTQTGEFVLEDLSPVLRDDRDYQALLPYVTEDLESTIVNIAQEMRQSLFHHVEGLDVTQQFSITDWLNSEHLTIDGCHVNTKIWKRIGEVLGFDVEEVKTFVPRGYHSGTYFPELDIVQFHSDNWYSFVPENTSVPYVPIRNTFMTYQDFENDFLNNTNEGRCHQMRSKQLQWNYDQDRVPYKMLIWYLDAMRTPEIRDEFDDFIQHHPTLAGEEIMDINRYEVVKLKIKYSIGTDLGLMNKLNEEVSTVYQG